MRILRLTIRNAFRHRLRSVLTIAGIAIAVTAFGFLRTVVTAWYSGVEASSANRLITRQAISFIFPLPYADKEQIARLPNVRSVSWANWFGGVYKDKSQFFARMAVDGDTYFDVYPEFQIEPDQLAQFKRERNACIVGADLAQQYGFKLGDIIPLDGDIYPGHWEFVVRGIYRPRDKTIDGTQMLFHWDYLNERIRQESPGRADEVGWYIVKIDDPARSAEVSDHIDALFANSRAETKTETERAFQQGFAQSGNVIIGGINFISFVIVGIIMLVLGNTMIMSARERTREYAVFKTLGFSAKYIATMIFGESLVLSIFGAAFGVPLTIGLVKMFEQFVPKAWFPVFYVEPVTYVLAATAALLVGVAAALFPMQRAMRTPIVEGLRFIG
ncbi:MAG TPA: FtsX-like permease family protein [Bacteroidota bacterium]|nr:FtsX-like permease family protein [Bacteroidota bacterium]